jgi:toxin ParE1/3/4
MNNYQFTPAAQEDLEDLWNWIATDNEQAADRLMADIRSACEQIAVHPALDGRHPQWAPSPLRFLLVRKNYWIAYDPAAHPVRIIRVLHAARDIPKVFGDKKRSP